MTKNTKTLKKYISSLPWFGLLIPSGMLAPMVLLNTKVLEDWSLNYFYFKALGAFLAYYYITWWNPGGRVTLNFDKSSYSQDEKALYNLIAKYKSKFWMTIPMIAYIVTDFVITRLYNQTTTGTIDGYFSFTIIGAGLIFPITLGIKHFSAWINIKRNWKKEFESK